MKKIFYSLLIAIILLFCCFLIVACDEFDNMGINEKNDIVNKKWTVQFQDLDGNLLYETVVEDGATAIFVGDIPLKVSTEKFTYSFVGWDLPLSNINKNTILKPVFSSIQNQVLITYVNYDDSLIATEYVGYGDAAQYKGVATKPSSIDKDYIFTGWDAHLDEVIEPLTVKAIFAEVDRLYTVHFLNEDGAILEKKQVKYQETVEYTGQIPTKESDGRYNYTFDGWDRSLENITHDIIIRATYSHEENIDYLSFTLSDDRTYYCAELKNGVKYYKDCYIPGEYNDLPVKIISNLANNNIENYYLGEGIENISSFTFANIINKSRFSNLDCPSTLKIIQNNAFNGCSWLENINLNNGLEVIGDNAFSNCVLLKSLVIPNTVMSLGTHAFSETIISEMVLPESITSLAAYALKDMKNVQSVTINANITLMPNGICQGDNNLTNFIIGPHITTLSDNIVNGCRRLTTISIPSNVTNINGNAFNESNINELIIPETVVSLEQFALSGMNELNKLIINANITTLPANMCYNDKKLYEVIFGEHITTIGNNSFSGCSGLVNISIPDNITIIQSSAFTNCTGLFDVVISSNIEEIGNYAFKESTKAWFYFKTTSLENVVLGLDWTCNSYQFVYSEAYADNAWYYNNENQPVIWNINN